MAAYARFTFQQFVRSDPSAIMGLLQQAYARDGFTSQYTRQTKAWARLIPQLIGILADLAVLRPESSDWSILLEYPLYRLRRRIDIVVLAGGVVVVIECKVGAEKLTAEDRRQVEEYALDLRDFHAKTRWRRIVPVLWSAQLKAKAEEMPLHLNRQQDTVSAVVQADSADLLRFFGALSTQDSEPDLVADEWDRSEYRPVPNVIEAATTIFAGHDVRSIANADADNLQSAASRLVDLIAQARALGRRYLLMLTGVPGSGKTLAGLHVVHSAITSGVERPGDIVYLSGNTPLVVVLREALVRDRQTHARLAGERTTLASLRHDVRARIQHINDFLQDSLRGSAARQWEHVIVFDEAQRAWDEKHGTEKFERTASEPALLMEIMSRHPDWCACVCLIGSGQEINEGEDGVLGWGDALRNLPAHRRAEWSVFAPTEILNTSLGAGHQTLGVLPPELEVKPDDQLELRVPQRSYRSPLLSRWVDLALAGDIDGARTAALKLGAYPLVMTRSLLSAKRWLREQGRGERRYGLVASSGARRLRADGLGVLLNASAGDEIAHWYLNGYGDIRSSFALEVPANEYTCQGLELDFTAVCWGGDLLWDDVSGAWTFWRLSGTHWQCVRLDAGKRFLTNSYRVLLTRAREGMMLWLPVGTQEDTTRNPRPLDATARYFRMCGVVDLDNTQWAKSVGAGD